MIKFIPLLSLYLMEFIKDGCEMHGGSIFSLVDSLKAMRIKRNLISI